MPPELEEVRSLRQRVKSLENRLASFERTVISSMADLGDLLPARLAPLKPMLLTPAAIVQQLQEQYPELAAHPALSQAIVQMLANERRVINQIFQQEQGNASLEFRRRIEALLHPKDNGNPQDSPD